MHEREIKKDIFLAFDYHENIRSYMISFLQFIYRGYTA